MNKTTDKATNDPTPESVPQPGDPRHGLAQATAAVRALIEGTSADQFDLPTPCDDFTVRQLLDHFVLVMTRLATIGRGEHWSTVMPEDFVLDEGHAAAFVDGAHGVMAGWEDPSKLGDTFEVPWGALPGAAVISFYTAELATHGWDLATATSRELTIPDEALGAALFAAKSVPVDGRDDPAIPFAPAVDPGADAPVLLQIAGWLGREVG